MTKIPKRVLVQDFQYYRRMFYDFAESMNIMKHPREQLRYFQSLYDVLTSLCRVGMNVDSEGGWYKSLCIIDAFYAAQLKLVRERSNMYLPALFTLDDLLDSD